MSDPLSALPLDDLLDLRVALTDALDKRGKLIEDESDQELVTRLHALAERVDEFSDMEREDYCEGCDGCRFSGIRWPAAPDSSTDQSFLERCDYCERYESDADAAIALVELLGGGIRIGCAMRSNDTGLPWNDAVRWFPEGATAKDINEGDLWPSSGYSLCVDREERDG